MRDLYKAFNTTIIVVVIVAVLADGMWDIFGYYPIILYTLVVLSLILGLVNIYKAIKKDKQKNKEDLD